METIIVAVIIVGAGVWFIQWIRGKAKGTGGCGCGCKSCATASDCPSQPETGEK